MPSPCARDYGVEARSWIPPFDADRYQASCVNWVKHLRWLQADKRMYLQILRGRQEDLRDAQLSPQLWRVREAESWIRFVEHQVAMAEAAIQQWQYERPAVLPPE